MHHKEFGNLRIAQEGEEQQSVNAEGRIFRFPKLRISTFAWFELRHYAWQVVFGLLEGRIATGSVHDNT